MSTRIQTASGIMFDPLNPKIEDIRIKDIAHALSNQCRFSGHTKRHYSVAEHSVYVSRYTRVGNELAGLLHDASEAYLLDIPSPIKQAPEFLFYRQAEKRLQDLIYKKYSVVPDWNDIHDIDVMVMLNEREQLMPWKPLSISDTVFRRIALQIEGPVDAYSLFLDRLEELM